MFFAVRTLVSIVKDETDLGFLCPCEAGFCTGYLSTMVLVRLVTSVLTTVSMEMDRQFGISLQLLTFQHFCHPLP